MRQDSDSGVENSSLHFLDYWRVIRSRKEIVLAVALLVTIAGTAYTFTLPQMYSASSMIKVNPEGVDIDPFGGATGASGSYDPFFLSTQFRIIQSRPVLAEVVERRNLQKVWGGQDELPSAVAINILRGSVNVTQVRDTSLIAISVRSKNPDEAANIANELAEVYRDVRLDAKLNETRKAIDAMRTQLVKQQERVDAAELQVEKIRQDLDVTLLGAQSVDEVRLAKIEEDRLSAQRQVQTQETLLNQLEAMSGEDLLIASEYVVNDPKLKTLRERILDIDVQLVQMQENYGINHPDYKRLESTRTKLLSQLAESLDGLKKGLRASLNVARQDYDLLESELDKIKETEKAGYREKLLPFNKANRTLEIERGILDVLKSRLVQEGITLEIPRTPVEIIEPARPNGRPVSPKFFLNILISVGLGLVAGVGLAYFIEYLDTSVKTTDDIERYVGLPVLGLIPQRVRPLIEEGPESEHIEAYRVLRTNLTFTNDGKTKGAFVVASGGAGEGKSTTIFNLAYVCAQRGEKVLLIDSDLRRPVQHRILETDNRFGLTNVLLRDVPVEETIKPTSVPNLYFLPSGRLPRTAMGLLEADRIRELVNSLRNKYDIILFDAPPVIGISDASIISSAVDGCVMVVQYRKYPRDMAVRTKEMLQSSGARPVGVVLNNINVMRDDYYYYYHSYYYNYYYRSQESESVEEV